MTTYITNIGSERLKELLEKLKKEDHLIIFHTEEEKQIPIDMITLFSNAKGTVEFKETGDEIETAYEVGRLAAQTVGKVRPVIEITGDSPVFDKLNALINSNKKAPVSRSSRSTAKESAGAPVKTVKKTDAKPLETPADKTEVRASGSSASKKKAVSSFDEAFDSFAGLIESLKTPKYDPSGCKHGVLLAVRVMNEDPSVSFEKALPTTTTASSASKFLANVKKEDIDRIIKAAKEVLKFDEPV